MGKLKPWYHTVQPREDLLQNRPLEASEFAVHLDMIRTGSPTLHEDYKKPERFFARTFLTAGLLDFCVQVARRLSGIRVETNAVFNMSTQFGGGKTHALAALFHLARGGPKASAWQGVDQILHRAKLPEIPTASTAVIVGTEFDLLRGRGGGDEPVRKTLWGEIAWQLGGERSYRVVAEHDRSGRPPGGDVVAEMLPQGPVLILMDELMSFLSRNRGTTEIDRPDTWTRETFANQMFNFLQVLSEQARARADVVLCVSIPASEIEMTTEDQRDFESLKKLLNRLGKAIMMSEKTELAEIIRRRLFEWNGLPDDARRTISAYAEWAREQPGLAGFEGEDAAEIFRASYPFHPALLSVFERKWQALPSFQRTRGVLRLLALWVAHAYQEQHRKGSGDPMIMLGSAPLSDPVFRAAAFAELGNDRLEGPVTTDIAGKSDSHALRLDQEARPEVRKARLHQQVASAIFFESNGGQSASRTEAQLPEIRAAVGTPEVNQNDIDGALEELTERCFYLSVEGNRYRFSMTPNLNQVLTLKRLAVSAADIDSYVREEINDLFKATPKDRDIDRVLFPRKSGDVPDEPRLTILVMDPEMGRGDGAMLTLMETLVREHGSTGRTCKSALIFSVSDGPGKARDSIKDFLAWKSLKDDVETWKRIDPDQKSYVNSKMDRARLDAREAIFRSYHYVYLLSKDNQLKEIDLGQTTSSQSERLVELIVLRLVSADEISDAVAPERLVQHWPHMREWTTRAVRDAFYSSPRLPRPRRSEVVKQTIARGVDRGSFGYCRKDDAGSWQLERFRQEMSPSEVEIADDVCLIREKDVQVISDPPRLTKLQLRPAQVTLRPGEAARFVVSGEDQHGQPFSLEAARFSAAGGACEGAGCEARYVAGEAPGTYEVEARCGDLVAYADVQIWKREEGPGPGPGGEPPVPEEAFLRWRGVVPSQRWMQFYQKVLSRFAGTAGLKIEVSFEAKLEGDAGRAKVEEARQGLRDLGLPDNIES